MIIGRVTGRLWHREVDDRIVHPLGMRHTFFPGASPHLPAPHADGWTRFAPGGPLVTTTEPIDADASGGHVSTTADLDRFLHGLFDGTLLDAASLAAMRRTVAVPPDVEAVWPGARYGLGIFSRPLPCGDLAWIPSGDQLGYRTRTAITADARRSAVVSMPTQFLDSLEGALAQEKPTTVLIDHALCAR